MSIEQIPEIAPTVSVDTRYGGEVDEFDIDSAGIGKFLQERDASDEEISDLTIHFGAGNLESDAKGIGDVVGNYDRGKKLITIGVLGAHGLSPWQMKQDHLTVLRHELEHFISDHDKNRYKKYRELEKTVPDRLKLRHCFGAIAISMATSIAASRSPLVPDSYLAAMATQVGVYVPSYFALLGGFQRYLRRDWSKYDHYRQDPEERRAHDAEYYDPLPEGLISIRSKK